MGGKLLKEPQYLKGRIENSDYLPCRNKKKCKIKACSRIEVKWRWPRKSEHDLILYFSPFFLSYSLKSIYILLSYHFYTAEAVCGFWGLSQSCNRELPDVCHSSFCGNPLRYKNS